MMVLSFNRKGMGSCLYSELIDLSSIGPLKIRRATTIEFNHKSQEWQVRRKGKTLFSHQSRAVCLNWEQQTFNR